VTTHDALKEQAWHANMALPAAGLVTGTFGNASAFDAGRGVFAIKPSGVAFSALSADAMVVVDLDLRVVQGTLRPSSDARTHAVLYRSWPDIAGVVHTHSLYAVAWAQAMQPIPVLGTTHADELPQDIPCTEPMDESGVTGDYEEETGRRILKTFTTISHSDVGMVLVASHGPFSWGPTPERAVERSIILEQLAQSALLTLQINPATPRLQEALIRKHFERKHGPRAYYGQG
jgi:L-ribulose-5-phosphate 4-epimerase